MDRDNSETQTPSQWSNKPKAQEKGVEKVDDGAGDLALK